MLKSAKTLILSSLLVFFLLPAGSFAESWEQVATRGFGEPSNDYAWSMATFQGKLYVGTLNFIRGAEIWSSSTGDPGSWQRVYNSSSSILDNIGVRNLYVDGDQAMYACTLNAGGAEIMRTANGRRWNKVGKLDNRGNAALRCMVRFGGYLYAGAGSEKAQLYRSRNGFNWYPVMTNPDLASTQVFDLKSGIRVNNNTMIGELAVFRNHLYAFTWTREVRYRDIIEHMLGLKVRREGSERRMSCSPGAFEVLRSQDGVNW